MARSSPGTRELQLAGPDGRYKWVALANTTAAVFMSALDGSIVIIALPAIFRGIHLDPLSPGRPGHGGNGGVRGQLHRPDAAAGQLRVRGIRHADRRERHRDGACSPRPAPPRSWAASRPGTGVWPQACERPSGTAVSIGAFFSLMIAGLASSLPVTLTAGLQHQGVPAALAHQAGALPPVASLFAAVIGVNPVQHLLASSGAPSALPAANQGGPDRPRVLSQPDRGTVPRGAGGGVRGRRRIGRGGSRGVSATRRPQNRPVKLQRESHAGDQVFNPSKYNDGLADVREHLWPVMSLQPA
jgi:hypothetical protein